MCRTLVIRVYAMHQSSLCYNVCIDVNRLYKAVLLETLTDGTAWPRVAPVRSCHSLRSVSNRPTGCKALTLHLLHAAPERLLRLHVGRCGNPTTSLSTVFWYLTPFSCVRSFFTVIAEVNLAHFLFAEKPPSSTLAIWACLTYSVTVLTSAGDIIGSDCLEYLFFYFEGLYESCYINYSFIKRGFLVNGCYGITTSAKLQKCIFDWSQPVVQ